jgi:hypothetical protein
MEERTYNINVSLDDFYRNYLIINRPLIDSILTKINKKKTHITDKPLRLLERLLYYNFVIAYENPKLSKQERWKLIIDSQNKDKIAKEIGLTDKKRVNTYLSRLRNLGVLDSEGIAKPFEIYPKEQKITYKISINGKGTR